MNTHIQIRKLAVTGLILLGLALTACGGAAGTPSYVVVTEIVQGEPVEVVVTVPPLEEPAGSRSSNLFPEATEEVAVNDIGPAVGDSAGESGNGSASSGSDEAPLDILPQERMIIKNGEIYLLVQNMDIALGQVSQIAVDNGGYILSSESHADEFAAQATVTIAVRSEQFETAMRRLRGMALEVQGEQVSGQDVSAEYVDLESRLRNLEATRDRVAKLLDQAKTVDEALKISKQLSEIEAEIEQVKGRMNFLQGRSAMSTITVTMATPVNLTATPTPTITPTPTPTLTPTPTFTATPWSPAYAVADAVKTQGGLLRGLTDTLLWLGIVVLPYAVVIGLVAYGGKRLFWRNGPRSAPPSSQNAQDKGEDS